jgi:SAM-dependent methyltransferase
MTWHYGLVSEWWANFVVDGPEIGFFQRFVERAQPALDAGCGSGRLLLPWLRAGLDVDGCDVSADMIARCRERAGAEGFTPALFVTPLHELDPPRHYRAIVVCGVFGIGTTRDQDQEGLRRLHHALEPGGTLLLDKEMPYSSPRRMRRWTAEGRAELPTPWSQEPDRAVGPDGSEYALWNRMLAADPLDQSVLLGVRAEKRRGGELVAEEEYTLSERMYFRNEILLMLGEAGFDDVEVRGALTDRAPAPEDDFLLFVARA